MDQKYVFTADQLTALLSATIKMFVEYRDIHGYQEENGADLLAVGEMFEGLDGEREMVREGAAKATMQTIEV